MTKRSTESAKGAVATLQKGTVSKPDGSSSTKSEAQPQIFDQIIIGDKDVGTYKNTIIKTLSIRKSTGIVGITSVVTHRKYIEKAILSIGLAQLEFPDKLAISMGVERETSKIGRKMLKIIFLLSFEVN
jgi:non-canonical (house-cleaning) NTP pyrophosphatase